MTVYGVLDRCVFSPDGCIFWEGARDGKGYPHYGLEGQTHRVFRTLYELVRGPAPDGLELHHECGQKACVNPFHVSPQDRRSHMTRDGRMAHRDRLGRFAIHA